MHYILKLIHTGLNLQENTKGNPILNLTARNIICRIQARPCMPSPITVNLKDQRVRQIAIFLYFHSNRTTKPLILIN